MAEQTGTSAPLTRYLLIIDGVKVHFTRLVVTENGDSAGRWRNLRRMIGTFKKPKRQVFFSRR